MTTTALTLRALCGCALLAASGALLAQSSSDSTVPPAAAAKQATEVRTGDPARWYQDDGSRATQLKILRKEIGAAYQEARNACAKGAAGARAACLKDAQAHYRSEMAGAEAQVDAAVGGSVTSTTTQVTPATPDTPAPTR